MAEHDPAAARYFVMQAVRLSGVVLVILGALVLAGRFNLPEIIGLALLFAGAVDFFAIPLFLARKWKSPE